MRDANVSPCCSWAALEWVRCLRRTRPERTAALVLVDTTARVRSAEDYPEGFSDDEFDAIVAMGVEVLFFVEAQAPGLVDDAGFRRWYERAIRLGAAPDVRLRRFLAACNTDVRGVLGSVQTPTLVVGHQGARSAAHRRYLADHIPGARLVELEGADNILLSSTLGRSSTQRRSFSPTIAVLPSLIGFARDRVVHRPRCLDAAGCSNG